MSKLTDQLRMINIRNTYDLLQTFGDSGKDVAVIHQTPDSRSVRPAGARVYSPSHKSDPDSHWIDHGHKTFSGKRGDALPAAVHWATEKYGITEWATDPTNRNARIPAYVLKRAKEAVKSIRTAVLSEGAA